MESLISVLLPGDPNRRWRRGWGWGRRSQWRSMASEPGDIGANDTRPCLGTGGQHLMVSSNLHSHVIAWVCLHSSPPPTHKLTLHGGMLSLPRLPGSRAMAGIEVVHLSQGWHAGSSFGAGYQGLEGERRGRIPYPRAHYCVCCGKLGLSCTDALENTAVGAGEWLAG